MMQRFDAGADVVIASRTTPGSRVEGVPPAGRDLMSKLFNIAVQAIAVPGLSDTQCGFKGFTAPAAKAIFSEARSDRFGFDVEALFLARKFGFQIVELPVVCRYHGGSSVNRLSDGARMFADIILIRLRHYSSQRS
jgi:dolichyl-phosphate beta-glucosyltransferase